MKSIVVVRAKLEGHEFATLQDMITEAIAVAERKAKEKGKSRIQQHGADTRLSNLKTLRQKLLFTTILENKEFTL